MGFSLHKDWWFFWVRLPHTFYHHDTSLINLTQTQASPEQIPAQPTLFQSGKFLQQGRTETLPGP